MLISISNKTNMEITQLRYFLAVAKSQKITATAEELHIAQPALTQAIHRLEKELGVPLFVSKGRGIIITEYGRYLEAQLSPVMDTLTRLPDNLKRMAHLENQTIHVNMLAASTLVTDAIISYKKTHREINFQLMQNEGEELYDLSVNTRLFFQGDPHSATRSFHEEIFLAVPRSSRFAEMPSIRLADVADEGFISLGGNKQLRSICDRYCKIAGFTPKIIFESDSPAAVRNLIAANIGIGFWPEYSWGRIDSDGVVLVPVSDPVCHRDILITYRQNKVDNRHVEEFYAYLVHYFEAIQADGKHHSMQ